MRITKSKFIELVNLELAESGYKLDIFLRAIAIEPYRIIEPTRKWLVKLPGMEYRKALFTLSVFSLDPFTVKVFVNDLFSKNEALHLFQKVMTHCPDGVQIVYEYVYSVNPIDDIKYL